MVSIPATKARARLYSLIDDTAQSHTPVQITGKRASAVLVSVADWAAVQETMFLLSIPGMRESIRDGLATPLNDCAQELQW